MSRLLRLFPGEWRRRYGAEVADLLADSPRPGRDRVDLVVSALALHVGHATERQSIMRKLVPVLACVLAVVGTIGAVLSATELTNGVWEIPGHWWSTLATLPLLAGLALLALWLWVRRRHSSDA